MRKFPRFLNGPNLVTVVRLPLAAAAAVWLWRYDIWPAVACLAAAVGTDLLDGWWARRAGAVTDFGKKLDPLVDKICAAAVGVVLFSKYGVPWWLFAAAVGRDVVLITAGAAALALKRGRPVPANFWGKAAALVMAACALAYITIPHSPVTVAATWLVIALLIISTASYGAAFFKTWNEQPGR